MKKYTAAEIYAVMLPKIESAIPSWQEGDEKTLREIVGSATYRRLQTMSHGRQLGHLLREAIQAKAVPLVRIRKGPCKTWLYVPQEHLNADR